MGSESRTAPRRAVLWSGNLEFGEYVFDCQIWNISLGGAKIRVGLPLLAGSEIQLSLDRYGNFRGVVMWNVDGNLGLKFEADAEIIRETFGDSIVKLGLEEEDLAAGA